MANGLWLNMQTNEYENKCYLEHALLDDNWHFVRGENRYNEMNRGNRHHEIVRIPYNVLSSKYQLSNRMGVRCAIWYVYELQYSLKKRFICRNLLFTGNLLHTYCDDHISSWSCATSGLWSTRVISGDVMTMGSRRMYEQTPLTLRL